MAKVGAARAMPRMKVERLHLPKISRPSGASQRSTARTRGQRASLLNQPRRRRFDHQEAPPWRQRGRTRVRSDFRLGGLGFGPLSSVPSSVSSLLPAQPTSWISGLRGTWWSGHAPRAVPPAGWEYRARPMRKEAAVEIPVVDGMKGKADGSQKSASGA